MKIIEGLKRVKANKEKIQDLQLKIKGHCANLSHETPVYGTNTAEKIREWTQSCEDTVQENIRLLVAVARTNLVTKVKITLGEKLVEKTIAEWVWRRREYAVLDQATFSLLTDRNLKEGNIPSSVQGAAPTEVKIVRHFNPEERDKKIALYRSEPHEIDAALEIVNATTDLLES